MGKVYYVDPNGNDSNTGEEHSPFKTIHRAQQEARSCAPGTVIVREGVYQEYLNFTSQDDGCEYIGQHAVISGGIQIPYEDTREISEDIRVRLSKEAAEKVRVIDLSAYGYTRDDWGSIYPVGRHCAEKYDDAEQGVNLEVFSGDKRMTLAKYPNEGFLKIDEVKDQGDVSEFPAQNNWDEWLTMRNPRGGTFIIDGDTNRRVKTWADPKDVWIFGYFQYDWAEASTPVANLNTVNRAVSPKYVSIYGYRKNADYYFFNILEELDMPGEYYLDRSTGLLYLYPYEEGDSIRVSMSKKPLIKAENTTGLVLDGFQVMYTRNNAVDFKANNCVLKNLLIKNVAEHGIVVKGTGNVVENCEVTQTGRGGICLIGGDRTALTPGKNKAVNNYIHHYSALYKTYQAGVQLEGVGNQCMHNEICFSPHNAILYNGNDHLIEYNDIHDVVLYSMDAGAIYSGRDWAAHGTVIRYNLIKNVGTDDLQPDGIYWDDGLSGQTAYGNIIINVKKFGILAGGGRDNVIRNNIIIGDSQYSLIYDARAYYGYFEDAWFRNCVKIPDGGLWKSLRAVPYKKGIWAEKYPTLAGLTEDAAMATSPDFPVNPANVIVEGNIIISTKEAPMRFSRPLYRYAQLGENPVYTSCEEAGFDLETLKFEKIPEGFEEIPIGKIGRFVITT